MQRRAEITHKGKTQQLANTIAQASKLDENIRNLLGRVAVTEVEIEVLT